MLARLLVPVLACAYLFALPGCATATTAAPSTASPEQQCRRMRGAAAGRGIGWTLGAVVLVAVVIGAVVSGGGGSPSFGGDGESDRAARRQARRDARAAACEAPDTPEPTDTAAGAVARSAVARPAPAPAPPPGYDAAIDAPPPGVYDAPDEPGAGPISRTELHEAILPHVDALRACAPDASGTLLMDARIDGATGRVTGIVLQGPIAGSVPAVCVSLVTANIHVRTFEGVADVRWGVRYPQ